MLIVVPYILCLVFSLFSDQIQIGQGGDSLESHLLNKEVLIEINGLYKSIDVEEYVLGVLPGTISADYHSEALKVQAILIRTNVLKEMEEKNTSDAADLSYEYLTVEDRITLFGERNYEKKEERFEKAVVDTAGQVLRKEGALIMALYHEVSIGKTISANEILGEDISYLQSVDSSQDVEAKNYMNVINYTWQELQEIELGNGTAEDGETEVPAAETPTAEAPAAETPAAEIPAPETSVSEMPATETVPKTQQIEKITFEIMESTENGFVKQLSVNGTIYTGEEAVEKYGLTSANFYVEEVQDGIRFVCLGKGNCMGLSQYGANYMALNGSKIEEIIQAYYGKVSLEEY